MKRIITLFALLSFGVASGQTTGELFQISNNNFGISTARSAAMGGAFTSLGADLSTLSINPAGMGLYRRSEVGITPQLRFENSKVDYASDLNSTNSLYPQISDKTNKMVIGSFGGVAVIDNGFNIGFSHNRLADYYSFYTSLGSTQSVSITDMFATQLNGVKNTNIGTSDPYTAYYNYPPVLWGAISAYQAYAVENVNGFDDKYTSTLAGGAVVDPDFIRKTQGGLDEFAMSASYNLNNMFYFGATIGIQSLNYKKTDTYFELSSDEGGADLSDLYYRRQLKSIGTGTNFKVGTIISPVQWFRLGVSYHSPTWMTINDENTEEVSAYFFDEPNKEYFADSPIMASSYNVSTPSRLLAGASFTIANRAIVSLDFKRTWFNKMSFANSFQEFDYRPEVTANLVDNYDAVNDAMTAPRSMINLNKIVTANYKPVNNYSVGVEGNLGMGFFLRGGYMTQESPYRNTELNDFQKIEQISGGLGFRTQEFSLDMAYVNSSSKELPYKHYANSGLEPEGFVRNHRTVESVILSMSIRF